MDAENIGLKYSSEKASGHVESLATTTSVGPSTSTNCPLIPEP